jgi:hypothetical protein
MILLEGGNIWNDTIDIPKEYVPEIVELIQAELPSKIKTIPNIGSAGFKVASGDIDIFLDAKQVEKNFDAEDEKSAKQSLAKYFQAKGYLVAIKGRNVHVKVPFKTDKGTHYAQVDLMVIPDAKRVADWHQHGPRGMYDDPKFKAGHLYILLNSIGKYLGLKVDAFGGTVMRRDNNEVVADNRKDAAKILLGPSAKADDLNSVASIMAALASDPDREGKLAQAKQDVQKGVLTLPEEVAPGTAAWFRKMGHIL